MGNLSGPEQEPEPKIKELRRQKYSCFSWCYRQKDVIESDPVTDTIGNAYPSNANTEERNAYSKNKINDSLESSLPNIILNPDFSAGRLYPWRCRNGSEGCLIQNKSPYPQSERERYALISNRNEKLLGLEHQINVDQKWLGLENQMNVDQKWLGLKQEINVSPDTTYELVARVGVLGIDPGESAEVQAILGLETEGSCSFEKIGSVDATSNDWTNLECSFNRSVDVQYSRVTLYLVVPDPGVNLIVARVDLRPSHSF